MDFQQSPGGRAGNVSPPMGKGPCRKHKSGAERITQHRLTEAQSERNTSPHLYLLPVAKWEMFGYNRGCGNSRYGYGVEWDKHSSSEYSGLPPAILRRYSCFQKHCNPWRKKLQGLFCKSLQKRTFPPFLEKNRGNARFLRRMTGLLNFAEIFLDCCGFCEKPPIFTAWELQVDSLEFVLT